MVHASQRAGLWGNLCFRRGEGDLLSLAAVSLIGSNMRRGKKCQAPTPGLLPLCELGGRGKSVHTPARG